MKYIIAYWTLLSLAALGLFATLHAQTAGQVEAEIKAKPLVLGGAHKFTGKVLMNKQQVVSDADFNKLKAAAKVDSARTVELYAIAPVSSAIKRPAAPKKSWIDSVLDFIIPGGE